MRTVNERDAPAPLAGHQAFAPVPVTALWRAVLSRLLSDAVDGDRHVKEPHQRAAQARLAARLPCPCCSTTWRDLCAFADLDADYLAERLRARGLEVA